MATKTKKAKEADAADETPQKIKVNVDKNGNAFLPGQEREFLVIHELSKMVKYVKLDLTPPFQTAQKALSVGKKDLEALIEKHKANFERDEEKGVLFYDDGEVLIEVQEKDAISYEVKKESE